MCMHWITNRYTLYDTLLRQYWIAKLFPTSQPTKNQDHSLEGRTRPDDLCSCLHQVSFSSADLQKYQVENVTSSLRVCFDCRMFAFWACSWPRSESGNKESSVRTTCVGAGFNLVMHHHVLAFLSCRIQTELWASVWSSLFQEARTSEYQETYECLDFRNCLYAVHDIILCHFYHSTVLFSWYQGLPPSTCHPWMLLKQNAVSGISFANEYCQGSVVCRNRHQVLLL